MSSDLIYQIKRWWPMVAVVLAGIVFFYLRRPRSVAPPKLNPKDLAIHQLKIGLGCSNEQARQLLRKYDGSASRALMDVKAGRAVIPGTVGSEGPVFAGEIRRVEPGEAGLSLVSSDGQRDIVVWDQECILLLGVLDSDMHPDSNGNVKIVRGRPCAQLLVKVGVKWHRYVLDGGRLDYRVLRASKQSTVSRNFHILLSGLSKRLTGLKADPSLATFLKTQMAPPYPSLAKFEKAALGLLPANSPDLVDEPRPYSG